MQGHGLAGRGLQRRVFDLGQVVLQLGNELVNRLLLCHWCLSFRHVARVGSCECHAPPERLLSASQVVGNLASHQSENLIALFTVALDYP